MAQAKTKSRAEEAVGKATMPSMDHFMYTDYEKIYEPADDTYLLIDAIWSEKQFLRKLQPRVCVELGPGSGAVSAFTSNLLKDIADEPVQLSQPPVASSAAFAVCLPGSGPPPAQPSSAGSGSPEGGKTALPGSSGIMLAVDINTDACEATAFTCRSNGASVEVVRSDKWGCMRKRLSAQVDVLIFNPPYVPTPDDEVGGVGIEAAWAGGLRGRRVLDQVMPQVGHLLSPNGVFYLIAVTENHPGEIADIMGEYGFACLVVAKRRAFNEALIVLKFRRKHAPGGESWQHADFEEGLSPP